MMAYIVLGDASTVTHTRERIRRELLAWMEQTRDPLFEAYREKVMERKQP